MTTTLPLFSTSILKRARILSFRNVEMTTAHEPALLRQEGVCEINTVLHEVMAGMAAKYTNKFVSPLSEGALMVRVATPVLNRLLTLVLDGINSAGLWSDGEANALTPIVCKCLSGYGAVLEFTNENITLNPEFKHQIAKREAVRPGKLPGWQLLKAREMVESHGGCLYIDSPLCGEKFGTSIRLFLPLAAASSRN